MEEDILVSREGMRGSLPGFLPDDPLSARVLTAQNELCELQKREEEVYAGIGKAALAQYGAEAFGEFAGSLTQLEDQIEKARKNLDQATAELEKRARKEDSRRCLCTCSCCGHLNPEGTIHCQECGVRLISWEKIFCETCGSELFPGLRFCGQCGARQPD